MKEVMSSIIEDMSFLCKLYTSSIGTVKLSKLVSQSTIFLDFRQQEVFE
ncbi:hypothetical protein [Rickettsia sp. MEAM1 (Bemisia tabaci)]|nr:hypothetical protein [Rickettsia sp. MEAM1 (Bemisia tabaci)]